MRLFLLALQPHLPPAELAADHAALVRGLEPTARRCCATTCAPRRRPWWCREPDRPAARAPPPGAGLRPAGGVPRDVGRLDHRPPRQHAAAPRRRRARPRRRGPVARPPHLPVRGGDRVDEAGDPLNAARRFQADPAYAERAYARVVPDGDEVWLQYWLWCYYNPKHLLGFGRHEGDWEVVQVELGTVRPVAATYSQHSHAEARDWEDVRRQMGRIRSSTWHRSRTPATSGPVRCPTCSASTTRTVRSRRCCRGSSRSAAGPAGTGAGARRSASSAGGSAAAARRARAGRATSGPTRVRGTDAPGGRTAACRQPGRPVRRQADVPEAARPSTRGATASRSSSASGSTRRRSGARRGCWSRCTAPTGTLVLASHAETDRGRRGRGPRAGPGGRDRRPRVGLQRAAPAQRPARGAGRLGDPGRAATRLARIGKAGV